MCEYLKDRAESHVWLSVTAIMRLRGQRATLLDVHRKQLQHMHSQTIGGIHFRRQTSNFQMSTSGGNRRSVRPIPRKPTAPCPLWDVQFSNLGHTFTNFALVLAFFVGDCLPMLGTAMTGEDGLMRSAEIIGSLFSLATRKPHLWNLLRVQGWKCCWHQSFIFLLTPATKTY